MLYSCSESISLIFVFFLLLITCELFRVCCGIICTRMHAHTHARTHAHFDLVFSWPADWFLMEGKWHLFLHLSQASVQVEIRLIIPVYLLLLSHCCDGDLAIIFTDTIVYFSTAVW